VCLANAEMIEEPEQALLGGDRDRSHNLCFLAHLLQPTNYGQGHPLGLEQRDGVLGVHLPSDCSCQLIHKTLRFCREFLDDLGGWLDSFDGSDRLPIPEGHRISGHHIKATDRVPDAVSESPFANNVI
jgi:hypothetical protein